MADYRDGWGEAERNLWDLEPGAYRELYPDEIEWDRLQEVFEIGWFYDRDGYNPSPDERNAAREEFWDITGTVPESFDWEAYRDYLAEKGSPSV